jgi:hypothetical protein
MLNFKIFIKIYTYIKSTSCWSLAYKNINTSDYKHISQPEGVERADCFVVEYSSKFYIFFEEFKNRKTLEGHLCVGELDLILNKITNIKVLLKKNYHLSYPHVFKYKNQWYMIPETHHNNKIDLYKFTEFPYQVTKVRTLLDEVRCVDSTLLITDKTFYLFTGLESKGSFNQNLSIFYSDDLLHNSFIPHPKNPISTSVKHSRMAGAILTENNQNYRLAQDCGVRYGMQIHKFKITHLSKDKYDEVLVETISPPKGCNAIHTYNRSEQIEVVDIMKNHTSIKGILKNIYNLLILLKR